MEYKLSDDGVGLLRYFTKTDYYHIHSDEMTVREQGTHSKLAMVKPDVLIDPGGRSEG